MTLLIEELCGEFYFDGYVIVDWSVQCFVLVEIDMF